MAIDINSALANLYSNRKTGVDVNYARNAIGGAAQRNPIDTSNPFGFITGRQDIQGILDKATQDAFLVKRKQGLNDLSRIENTAVADRNATIAGMRQALAGQMAGGASMGGANASGVQAALGLGMNQGNNLNMGLQALQMIAEEQRAAMSQNAGLAIDKSNTAKTAQATAANEQYASDATFASTALQALASLFWPGYDGSKASVSYAGSGGGNDSGDDEVITPTPVKVDPKKSNRPKPDTRGYVRTGNAGAQRAMKKDDKVRQYTK